MNRLIFPVTLMLTTTVPAATAADQTPGHPILPGVVQSAPLQNSLDTAVDHALRQFSGLALRRDQLALTLVDITHPTTPAAASHRGQEPIYPASVVKLFYLVAVQQWLEEGRLEDTPELRRAMRDMIVHSYNEATHYIVDLLTQTTSGPELSDAELEVWYQRRNAVNRYFTERGYRGINVNKKPWCEGPYGRETQAIQRFDPGRNWLTTDATARLLVEIFLDRHLPPHRCAAIRELLARDPHATTADPDDQAQFTGPALPPGAQLWSKAGWTSQTRHDAACILLPNGRRYILVIFTVDHANERQIIPTLARAILDNLP